MMVEKSPYIENVGQLLEDLNQATEKLTKVSEKKQIVSKQELNDLINVLHTFNDKFKANFWNEKKLVPEDMKQSIEEALAAIQLFKRTQPEEKSRKNVEQAIVALFSTLAREINDFDKNLKNLKDYKIGRKVEKTNQSKQS